MILRLVSLSFLLAALSVALVWLTISPVLLRLLDAVGRLAPASSAEAALLAHIRELLPLYLSLNLGLIGVATFVILYFVVGRPLRRTEASIHQLEQLRLDLPLESGGGPLLSRVQGALRKMADALAREQGVTRAQLAEVRAANERLSRAQAELVASERLATVGRLAAGIAHEVGNPLSGILGYLSLLRSRSTDAASVEFVGLIEHEVQRINGIVRGLLDLGRPIDAPPQPLELAPLVATVIGLGKAGVDLRGVLVDVDVPSELIVRAAPGPLSQILLNLLLNAAQAMGGTGSIRVVAARLGDRIALAVEDRGPGISPEVQAHLFEPFFTTKPAGKGTGLGLAVSEHLARSMDATLNAEPGEAGGARFVLDLPSA